MTPPRPLRLRLAAALACALLSSCEEGTMPQGQGETPTDAGATGSGQAPIVPKIRASSSASGSASVSVAVPIPSLSIEVPTGPLKWKDYGGTVVKPDVKPGEKTWAVIPVSEGWDTLKFTELTVDRVEGDDAVFKLEELKREVWVPGAFVNRTKPAEGLVKGDAVAVATKGARAFARVTSAEGGKVKVRYRYAGDIQELELDPIEILKLDGTLKFASVAAFSESKEQPGGGPPKIDWHPGYYVSTHEEKTWIITTSGKPLRVAANSVKPLSVHLLHKAGDKVWFANSDLLVDATVQAVEDDGLRYKLKLGNGEETSVPFEAVSTPIK